MGSGGKKNRKYTLEGHTVISVSIPNLAKSELRNLVKNCSAHLRYLLLKDIYLRLPTDKRQEFLTCMSEIERIAISQ